MALSIRAYARHRGVTDTAVHKAIRTGRITPEPDGTLDAQRADQQWASNTDTPKNGTRSRAPRAAIANTGEQTAVTLPAGGTSLLQARTVNEVVKAQTNKVRLARLKGELIDRSEAIIDDFAISPMGARERTDLLELLDDRVGTRATLITSQLPIENWHDYIGDPTLADAILDRLVHSAHKIHIEGETMRKRAAADKQNASSKSKKFD